VVVIRRVWAISPVVALKLFRGGGVNVAAQGDNVEGVGFAAAVVEVVEQGVI